MHTRERRHLVDRTLALIDHAADTARDELLLDLARFQAAHVEPYRRLLAARGIDPHAARHPGDLPALPTDVFRHARVAAHSADDDLAVFRTSGTTHGRRGEHFFRDLTLYDHAARAAARASLFPDLSPDRERLRLISLIPDPAEAPDSSLAYMVGRFRDWFGADQSVVVWTDGQLRDDLLARALDDAVASGEPVALLGTSFAFVHAEDALAPLDRRWALPPGSRVMQTGGFKGKSREVTPEEMLSLVGHRYGVPESRIVAEYGMTELSSQMYETTLADPRGPRRFVPPPWLRVTIVHPETLEPVPAGDEGLVRIDDPANVDTAWAVQTSDRAVAVGPDGFRLLGRAEGAVPRGCSLAVEEALWS
jgi:acyl-CoA synthetase (AMP-forming)/AMP-acid ligase II